MIALVTGAASGIGKATAKAFSKRGETVVIADIDEEGGRIVEKEIINNGGKALFVKCDVSVEADVKSLIETIVEKYGRLDIAFNNAGILHKSVMLHEISEQLWDQVYSVNCKGVFLCMKHELKQMMQQNSGVIINNSSISGIKGLPSVGAYTTSKHGVSALTKAGALEYAKYNIRVNQIAPGCVDTSIWNVLDDIEKEKAEYVPVHLIERFARAEEIAAAVLYLSSSDAGFITGITLPVDGGALTK